MGVDGEEGEEKEEDSPGAAVEEGGDGWEEAALVQHLHQPTEKRWKRGRQKRESERRVLGMDGRERFWVDYLLNIEGAFILDFFWLLTMAPF